MADRILRFGVIGLSRGFVLSRAMFADPRVRLTAAADPRREAQAAFEAEFGGRAYADAGALLADPDVDAVYVASPHGLHAEQAIAAARAGKHVLVEKPMALSLEDCRAMRLAAEAAGVILLVGPSHGYDLPIAKTADLIAGGGYGRLRMLTLMTFTDFMYRPRTAEERQAGAVLSQAAHQVDVAMRLAGARVARVRAQVQGWDAARGGAGAWQALLEFENGVSAQLTYSGYGRFDTDALMDWTGELGQLRTASDYGAARRRLGEADEADLKRLRSYGAAPAAEFERIGHEHFGFVLASCDGADLRPTAHGVEVYGEARETLPLPPPAVPRQGVVDELWDAIVEGRPPLHDAAWGEANLAVCLAIVRSSEEGREIALGGT
ncbi:Gfo/Idh/MocA family protein [Phenylobacterium sp. VNQ135]|uniref:Gfo/Idh/MocA family protein n=1 Tax=Phenylobacterium sp. VNQ135 TaxID=3400922 RepID=UPI003C0E468E